jgi:hypothetical protein
VEVNWQNPYVGPRAFRRKETLYGRNREIRELADLLTAQRIVLLHAPSGAGKTSLIQAGLSPLLEDEDFAPTPPLRVNTRAPNNRAIRNPYVYSVAFYLLGEERDPRELAAMSLSDVIAAARRPDRTPVLVLDQFEEILLMDPTDRDNQRTFFEDLGQALAESGAWALLSMREDYMGGLDRFVRYIPGHLSATYRLDFLGHEAARAAIQRPAEEHYAPFADDAAKHLVKELATVQVQRPGGREEGIEGPYVHPFQLQVVCSKLWRSVRDDARARGRFDGIKLKDVKRHVDIPGALQSYYAGVVRAVAKNTGADETAIRRWFETDLITPQGFRSQTLSGPVAGDVDPTMILRELERLYLVRSDTRAEATWYELSHDKLIEAVVVDNENWERPRLQPWQLAAREWEDNHDPRRLLTGPALRLAPQADSDGLTHSEKSFLEASERAERERGLIERTRTLVRTVYGIAVAEFFIIVVLGTVLILYRV